MGKLKLLVLSAAALALTTACQNGGATTSEATSEATTSEVTTSETSEATSEKESSSKVTSEAESESSSEVTSETESEFSSEEESSSEEVINDGSLEHPFTVSEGYAIAVELAPGADAGAQYFIKGIVDGDISWYNGRLSFNIVDDVALLYVYNMNNSENKASYKEGQYDFAAGDEIIVAGTFKNYVDKSGNSKLEICYVKDVANCYKAG